MEVALETTGMASALFRSYQAWAKRHPKYYKIASSLSDTINRIILAAFSEIENELKPGAWEVWWASNHNRYISQPGVLQRDLIKMHEVMYHFLSAFARGELEKDDGDRKGKRKAKA